MLLQQRASLSPACWFLTLATKHGSTRANPQRAGGPRDICTQPRDGPTEPIPRRRASPRTRRCTSNCGPASSAGSSPPARGYRRAAHSPPRPGVSRNTVLAAFEQLQAEGYITGRQGSGTYVAQVLPEQLLTTTGSTRAPSPSASTSAKLSARGERLARARRVPLPSVLGHKPRGTSFLIGLPALDAFPFDTWARALCRPLPQVGTPADALRRRRPATDRCARRSPPTSAPPAASTAPLTRSSSPPAPNRHWSSALGSCSTPATPPGSRTPATSAPAPHSSPPAPASSRSPSTKSGSTSQPASISNRTPASPWSPRPISSRSATRCRWSAVSPSSTGPAHNDSWIIEDDYDAEFRYVGKPHAALMAIDSQQRVIYVGTFSKALFPSLRLGYIIAPRDLVDGFLAAHLSTDMHAHLIDQAVVADFIDQGHFARHLRRMRVLHHERQHELIQPRRVHHRPARTGTLRWRPPSRRLARATTATTEPSPRTPSAKEFTSGPCRPTTSTPRAAPALLLGYAGTTCDDMRYGIDVLNRVLR